VSGSYAYLDESGALPDGPGYFVVAILLTHYPRSLQKIIRTAREKMKSSQPGHRQTQELKFHNASDPTKRRILAGLCNREVEIYLLALELGSGVPDTPENYAEAVWRILEDCLERYPDLDLTVDLHFTAPAKRQTFDRRIVARAGRSIAITHKDSQQDTILQLADFVAGATYQKYARGNAVYWESLASCIATEKVIKWP
jgi:hypothetical protein